MTEIRLSLSGTANAAAAASFLAELARQGIVFRAEQHGEWLIITGLGS